uniref:PDZ domain-containing protein n=1 Tax=Castor canadensis TaxID=51338 RepID=A0A8C0WF18_CASCN
MEHWIPHDDYPVVLLAAYENPPAWISPNEKGLPDRHFISKVIPDSNAHQAGLQEGNLALAVNDVVFQDTGHSKAVVILKTAHEIDMVVCLFLYNYHCQKERTVR